MKYLRSNYYGVLIDCAVACWGVMWAVGTFAEWAKVVLYAAFAIGDVYQLEWVGDREGRLEQRERFGVLELCVRVIQDWRVLVEAQAVASGDGRDLEGARPDTRTGQVPVPNPGALGSAGAPEPIATGATSTPLNTSHTQT